MMRKLAKAGVFLAILGGLVFWFVTRPQPLEASVLASAPAGDAVKGEAVFWHSGCASCHSAPKSEGEERKKLIGGLVLKSPFGDFHAPNISMHPTDGIGTWTFDQFANAMMRGVSPEG